MARPWIEDANEYQVLKDLTESGIHQTPEIRDYLDYDNTQRTVLLAPKGCGKTLLIKHKRKTLQNRGFECIPNDKLVSLSPSYAGAFDNERTQHIRETPQYWSMLWQIALVIAVLRGVPKATFDVSHSSLRAIFRNEHLVDPFYIFVQLLNLRPGAYFEVAEEFRSLLLPAFSQLRRSQVAVFIDNVDECFGHHLSREKRSGLHGQIVNEFWHDAQIGLLMATHQIARHNSHIKIFATIRTEAFSARQAVIPDLANVRTHTTPLKFDKDDLRHIFEENIAHEAKDRLAEPSAIDPFVRFVGRDAVKIRHPYTSRMEHIFDYIYRHSFGRPRDLMMIGRTISALRRERRTAEALRSAVNSAAAEIAKSYLTEVAPHFNWFDQDLLFSRLQSNVLSLEELLDVASRYEADLNLRRSTAVSTAVRNGANGEEEVPMANGDGNSAVADMYAAGLIGATQPHPVKRDRVQHFTTVFDLHASLPREKQILPTSDHYLVHNVLESYVRERYAREWRPNFRNVVVPDGVWLDDDKLMYVMQFDVCGSEQVRSDPVKASAFASALEDAVQESVDQKTFNERVGGDGWAFASRNGYILVRAAHDIAQKLKTGILEADIRVGMDFGPVTLGKDRSGQPRFESGPAVGQSAKLQASSAPGALLTLPPVATRLLAEYDVNWHFFELVPSNTDFRAKLGAEGWSIAEKSKPEEAQTIPKLKALRLQGVTFEM